MKVVLLTDWSLRSCWASDIDESHDVDFDTQRVVGVAFPEDDDLDSVMGYPIIVDNEGFPAFSVLTPDAIKYNYPDDIVFHLVHKDDPVENLDEQLANHVRYRVKRREQEKARSASASGSRGQKE